MNRSLSPKSRQVSHVRDSIVRAEPDEVVCLHADDIREEVPTRQREVLDDEVERIVRVLDAWDRDISHLYAQSIRGSSRLRCKGKRTLSMMLGKMTLRMSIQSSGLNFRLPSLSKSRSLVRRAQSSPNLTMLLSAPRSDTSSFAHLPLIQRIIPKSAEPFLHATEQVVKVIRVLLIVEPAPALTQFICLVIALRLEHVSGV